MRHNGQEPDDRRQILAEQDMLAEFSRSLRDMLRADIAPTTGNGAAALQALMKQSTKEAERTLSEREAAQWVGLTATNLANRRRRGTGPAVHAMWNGRAVYTPQALHDWQAA